MSRARIPTVLVAAFAWAAALAASAEPVVPMTSTAATVVVTTQDPSDSGVVVRGMVLGPDSARLANQVVVLHRVRDGTGATIAQATTADNGEFVLRAPGAAQPDAIYFVAARYEEELYIAAPFRAADNGAPQVLQVGIAGTSASALVAPAPVPMGRSLTNRNWLLLALPLSAVIAVVAYLLAPRGRVPHRRALLIRAAELDERLASMDGPTDRLRDERARLAAQLRSPANRGA